MIALFTDFGIGSPYVGQMHAALARDAPEMPVIDLCNDLAPFDAGAAAFLLPAFAAQFPADTVFLSVVDPGVGSERGAVMIRAGAQWFVGPDNGLFNEVARHAADPEWWDITWRPDHLSASFHGRDLFAPVAARLARGEPPPGVAADPRERIDFGSPPDLARVVYIDAFGNALTGLRAETLADSSRLVV
ncbi:MAG: SAM-dependent chlorinase/fluorinase, partial [Proteobacteria bacterium]|nr:SAM-dependent chlorinase/fluorinase [Pseudomonadota bacterium]